MASIAVFMFLFNALLFGIGCEQSGNLTQNEAELVESDEKGQVRLRVNHWIQMIQEGRINDIDSVSIKDFVWVTKDNQRSGQPTVGRTKESKPLGLVEFKKSLSDVRFPRKLDMELVKLEKLAGNYVALVQARIRVNANKEKIVTVVWAMEHTWALHGEHWMLKEIKNVNE